MITRPTRSDGVTSIQPGTANHRAQDVGAEVCRGGGKFIGTPVSPLSGRAGGGWPCSADASRWWWHIITAYGRHRTQDPARQERQARRYHHVGGGICGVDVLHKKKGGHPMWQPHGPHLAAPSVGWHSRPVSIALATEPHLDPRPQPEWERGEPSSPIPRIPVPFDAPRAPRSDCRGALCSGSRIA